MYYIYIFICVIYIYIYIYIYINIKYALLLCVNIEHPQLNCKIQELHLYIFIYKNYISTRRWSNERIKTKTTMFQENSNTLTNMS